RGARPSASRSPAGPRRPGSCAAPTARTARQGGSRSWSCRHRPWNWPPALSSCASSGSTKRSARVHRPACDRDRAASTASRRHGYAPRRGTDDAGRGLDAATQVRAGARGKRHGPRAVIELRQVHRRYAMSGQTVHALAGVDLRVAAGEFVAITGPSGSGKSSLLNILGCLDHPSSGHYLVEGRDVATLDDEAASDIRNRRIGFVFQSFHLLPRLTVLENVLLP